MNSIQIGRYLFNGPYLLSNFDEIDRAAVYVILCKDDVNSYGVVYVGETGKLGTRLHNHNKKECWKKYCNGTLYVAIFYTPSNTFDREDRLRIERELIDKFKPPCNEE
jgi:predicted GIY-YIG superfamily endonuclease